MNKFVPSCLLFGLVSLLFTSCVFEERSNDEATVLGISKWYQGYRSAYTPTHDTPYLDGPEIAWLIEQGLSVDLEVVSAQYQQHPAKMDTLRDLLVPKGFGYFGHGHHHVDHDTLDYDSAHSSYRINFEYMKASGLKPVSYAYPGGFGMQAETHRALRDAGFLSARLAWQWSDTDPHMPPYIMAGTQKEPPNWYMLPALYMQDLAFEGCRPCVNNPEEFAGFLYRSVWNEAWLISVYHAIGWDGKNGRPLGWGFYDLENFYNEMRMAKSLRDQGLLWIASMDAVTLYTMERNATSVRIKRRGRDFFDLHLTNALDKSRFDHPLTVNLSIPGKRGRKAFVTHPDVDSLVAQAAMKGDTLSLDLAPSDKAYRIWIP